jgi:hypothetical protein
MAKQKVASKLKAKGVRNITVSDEVYVQVRAHCPTLARRYAKLTGITARVPPGKVVEDMLREYNPKA